MSQELKLTISDDDYAFLRLQTVRYNMNASSFIKKLILEERKRQEKQLKQGLK